MFYSLASQTLLGEGLTCETTCFLSLVAMTTAEENDALKAAVG